MSVQAVLLVLSLSALSQEQNDPARQSRALVEDLGSESIEERERAGQRLLELGARAVEELERATRNPDAELAARARDILEHIRIRGALGPHLLSEVPLIDEILRKGTEKDLEEAVKGLVPQ